MLAVTVDNVTRQATKQIHADDIVHRLRVADEADTYVERSLSAWVDSLTYWFDKDTYDRPV